jgi:hypothetical protein
VACDILRACLPEILGCLCALAAGTGATIRGSKKRGLSHVALLNVRHMPYLTIQQPDRTAQGRQYPAELRKEKKNHAGSKTLPASFKEKETQLKCAHRQELCSDLTCFTRASFSNCCNLHALHAQPSPIHTQRSHSVATP